MSSKREHQDLQQDKALFLRVFHLVLPRLKELLDRDLQMAQTYLISLWSALVSEDSSSNSKSRVTTEYVSLQDSLDRNVREVRDVSYDLSFF